MVNDREKTQESADVPPISFRTYERRDADAVQRLHELAFRDSRTDPDDIPGIEDLRNIHSTYLESGGSFVVGTVPGTPAAQTVPRVDGDALVAMGGFLPSEAGHDDERTVPGAAELHRMRVAPSYQRYGYGRELLRVLENAIQARGYNPVLATTAKRQQAAVRFYDSEGFELVGEATNGEYELHHFEKYLR
jgi:ribosomal protein S18 acetylase RimI-like enzyme